MSTRTKRKTVTFEPADDVKLMLRRACSPKQGLIRGLQTYLCNTALRAHLKKQGYGNGKKATA